MLTALAAGLCLAVSSIHAQDRQGFTETTEVTAVEIPVQVLLDGKPVRDLKADDFVVYQDKEKQAIAGFDKIDLLTIPDGKAADVPASARRHFLLLFDLSFSEPKSVVQARDAAKELLDHLHASDVVAVATYAASRGPELVLGFTPDRDQVRAAIDTLGLPELIDRTSDPLKIMVTAATNSQLYDAKDEVGGAEVPRGGPGGGFTNRGGDGGMGSPRDLINEEIVSRIEAMGRESERVDQAYQTEKVTALARSFTDLAKLMRSVSGRKYVVYLSEGYDSSLLLGSEDQAELKKMRESADKGEIWEVNSEKRFGDSTATNDIDAMLQEFRRADCVVQAVNIAGLRAADGGQAGDLGYNRKGGRDSLFQMARDTGGDLYENFNDLAAAMGKMLERTGVTYVLTIQPATQPDGSYHPLRVELKNAPRGARVVSRPGYFSPRPFAQRSRFEKMLTTAGQVLLGEEGGTVRASLLAVPMQAFDDEADVPLVVQVDGADLLEGQDSTDLPAEIYVYAMDDKGSVRDYVAQTLALDLTKLDARLRQSGIKFYGHLQLPPGSYKARVLVRNGHTGRYGLKVVPIEVPDFAKGGPMLLQPFFPEPGSSWLVAKEAPRAGRREVPLPFRLGDQPFLPAAHPVLDDGKEARFSLMGYNLEGDLQIHSQVLTADGREVEKGDLAMIGREPAGDGDAERLDMRFRPADLKPGEYLLKVTVVDAAGKSGTSTTPFVVAAGSPGERS